MSYEKEYPETVEIPEEALSEAQKIIVSGLIRQGEFNTRETFIKTFQEEIKTYLDEVDGEPNEEWVNGLNYAIHLIKEMKVIND